MSESNHNTEQLHHFLPKKLRNKKRAFERRLPKLLGVRPKTGGNRIDYHCERKKEKTLIYPEQC